MLYQVEGAAAYCYTAGKPWQPQLPALVFLHGAQNDHSVWALQSRYFAHHGFNVLAVDLPGHSRSKGAAKTSVAALAHWLLALLDVAGVAQATLIGHSMGSLIALELAHLAPQRVRALALLGSTYPMTVSPDLLASAQNDEARAMRMINSWSHSTIAAKPSFPGPGCYTMGAAQRLKEHIASVNPEQVLYTDFLACNAYANGAVAAAAVRCPTLFIFGVRDVMTPARSTALLTAAISHGQVVSVDAGHEMMAEQPDAVLDALIDFLAKN